MGDLRTAALAACESEAPGLARFPDYRAAGDADRRLGEAAGMDDYLTKPILIDALRGALERRLR